LKKQAACVLGIIISVFLPASALAAGSALETDARDVERVNDLASHTVSVFSYLRQESTPAGVPQFRGAVRASFDWRLSPMIAVVPEYSTSVVGVTSGGEGSGLTDHRAYVPVVFLLPISQRNHAYSTLGLFGTAGGGTYDTTHLRNAGENRVTGGLSVGAGLRFAIVTLDAAFRETLQGDNDKYVLPDVVNTTATTSMSQRPSSALDAHFALDVGEDAYLSLSYYWLGLGSINVPSSPTFDVPRQNIHSLRFGYGLMVNRTTQLLFQLQRDLSASGGAEVGYAMGLRLSHDFQLW